MKVYHRESNELSWKQLGPDINGDADGDLFRKCLASSVDGNTLVIGAPGYWGMADRPGYVRVYCREGVVLVL